MGSGLQAAAGVIGACRHESFSCAACMADWQLHFRRRCSFSELLHSTLVLVGSTFAKHTQYRAGPAATRLRATGRGGELQLGLIQWPTGRHAKTARMWACHSLVQALQAFTISPL